MHSDFRNLVAYQRATAVAHRLHRAIETWPAFDRWTLGTQLVRAADSIGANIAEAEGRWHPRDKRRLLLIARGSVYESEHWITYAAERDLLPANSADALDEVVRALNGLIKRWAPD
jgi:four helix bundle protein